MKEKRLDLRNPAQAQPEETKRSQELCLKINHTMPGTEEMPFPNDSGMINEMATMNKKDTDCSPLPFGTFAVILHSNDPNPPHIHIINKKESYELKYTISDGELIGVVKEENKKNAKATNYSDITQRVIKWLSMPSIFKPEHTNQTICQLFWNVYHS